MGSAFPRQTRDLGQGADCSPPASMGPSPAAGRKGVEGGSALPKAEPAGSLDRPGNRITFYQILHSHLLSFTLGRLGGQGPDRCAWRRVPLAFGRKKARIFPNGKTRTLSNTKTVLILCETLILYTYSITDASREIKPSFQTLYSVNQKIKMGALALLNSPAIITGRTTLTTYAMQIPACS